MPPIRVSAARMVLAMTFTVSSTLLLLRPATYITTAMDAVHGQNMALVGFGLLSCPSGLLLVRARHGVCEVQHIDRPCHCS